MVVVADSSPKIPSFWGRFRGNSLGKSDGRGCGALASLKSEGTIEPGVGYVLMVGRSCTFHRSRSLTREMGNALPQRLRRFLLDRTGPWPGLDLTPSRRSGFLEDELKD